MGTLGLTCWATVVRELAGADPELQAQVRRYPLREALLEYVERLKDQLAERYRAELALWAALAPHQKKASKPPAPHPLLRERP